MDPRTPHGRRVSARVLRQESATLLRLADTLAPRGITDAELEALPEPILAPVAFERPLERLDAVAVLFGARRQAPGEGPQSYPRSLVSVEPRSEGPVIHTVHIDKGDYREPVEARDIKAAHSVVINTGEDDGSDPTDPVALELGEREASDSIVRWTRSTRRFAHDQTIGDVLETMSRWRQALPGGSPRGSGDLDTWPMTSYRYDWVRAAVLWAVAQPVELITALVGQVEASWLLSLRPIPVAVRPDQS